MFRIVGLQILVVEAPTLDSHCGVEPAPNKSLHDSCLDFTSRLIFRLILQYSNVKFVSPFPIYSISLSLLRLRRMQCRDHGRPQDLSLNPKP